MHLGPARRPWRLWRLLWWLRAACARCPYPLHCPTQDEACPPVVCPGGATVLELTTAAPQDVSVWPLWPPAAPTAQARRAAAEAVPTSFTDTGLVCVWDYSFANLTSHLGCDTSYGLNLSGAESAVGVFEGSTGVARPHGASRWDTRRLRNASRAFAGLPALAKLDLSRWNTARLEDVTEMFDGDAALARTGVGSWTGLPNLQRFSGLFRGLGSDFREPLTAWTTPALAPGSVDCTRLEPYTALDPTRWPAACSRSLFSARVLTHAAGATAALTLAPTAGPGANFTVDRGDGSALGSCAHADGAVCTHVYTSAGDYWLRLGGRVDGLRYVEGAWVVDVVAWGDVQLYHPVGSTTPLFTPPGATNYLVRYLAPTAGSRALHGVALEYLLRSMSEFVGDARDWDWSWLTPATHPSGFRSLFEGCTKFNQDLGGWNTSGVASLCSARSAESKLQGVRAPRQAEPRRSLHKEEIWYRQGVTAQPPAGAPEGLQDGTG
eukprot:g26833.t1